jgi:hypothetical protein
MQADAAVADRQGQPPVHRFASLSLEHPGVTAAPPPNRTGLPDRLKAGIEHVSGFAMDDVRVQYNSTKPAGVQALAYTKGTEIHVGPGQEQHLPHEAWHVVQQAQGRAKPTLQMKGAAINDDATLEREADTIGRQAAAMPLQENVTSGSDTVPDKQKELRRARLNSPAVQRKFTYDKVLYSGQNIGKLPQLDIHGVFPPIFIMLALSDRDFGDLTKVTPDEIAEKLAILASDEKSGGGKRKEIEDEIKKLKEKAKVPQSKDSKGIVGSAGQKIQQVTKIVEHGAYADKKEAQPLIKDAEKNKKLATEAGKSAAKTVASTTLSLATGGIAGKIQAGWDALKSGSTAKRLSVVAANAEKAAKGAHDQKGGESIAPQQLVTALRELADETKLNTLVKIAGAFVPLLETIVEWLKKEKLESAIRTIEAHEGNEFANRALYVLEGNEAEELRVLSLGYDEPIRTKKDDEKV